MRELANFYPVPDMNPVGIFCERRTRRSFATGVTINRYQINRYQKPELPEPYVPLLQTPFYQNERLSERAGLTGRGSEPEIKHESASMNEPKRVLSRVSSGNSDAVISKRYAPMRNVYRASITKHLFATRDKSCVHCTVYFQVLKHWL